MGFRRLSVTSKRHSCPGWNLPSMFRNNFPATMVASRQAASLLGSSSPSVSMPERSSWTLKKYLGIRENAELKIRFPPCQRRGPDRRRAP
jgi:hypothetical protein